MTNRKSPQGWRPLNLVGADHTALHRPADPILEANDPTVHKLAMQLLATVRVRGGAGLAAPQVGIPLQMLVTFEGSVLINPTITELEGEDVNLEACLSLPGRTYRVSRAQTCLVNALDFLGRQVSKPCEGFEARLVQHEVDHLAGTLIRDIGEEVRGQGQAIGY